MVNRSGKPSRLASPSLKETGSDGVKDVSDTSSDGDEGNREESGNLTKF